MLKHVNSVLVTNLESANTTTAIQDVKLGDVLILDSSQTIKSVAFVPGTDDLSEITIAAGMVSKGEIGLRSSGAIVGKNIKSVGVRAYRKPVQKQMVIGFDGTTGDITAPLANVNYAMIVVLKDDQRVQPYRQSRLVLDYVTDATPDKGELVTKMVSMLNRNTYFEVYGEALVDGTETAGVASDVINGSRIVKSTAHGLSAGNIVRLGTNAPATAVYYVTEIIDANTYKIGAAFTGTTATGVTTTKMTAITKGGIRLIAKTIPYNGINTYQFVDFDASLFDRSASSKYPESSKVTVLADGGNGYWEQARDAEFFAMGYLGQTNRTLFPEVLNQISVVAQPGYQYNVWTIEYSDVHEGSLQALTNSPKSVEIYFQSASALGAGVYVQGTKEAAFETVLKSYLDEFGITIKKSA